MLRLKIDGQWDPKDFIEILYAIESFYCKLALTRRRRFGAPYWLDEYYLGWSRDEFGASSFESMLDRINENLLAQARYEIPPYRRLVIASIQYASPGGMDLLGVGKIFDVLAKSIGRMKVYFDDAHIRSERDTQATLVTELKRIEVDKERENLHALKIRNAQDALRLLDSYPEMRDALVPLLVRDQDAIATRLAEGKLISARVFPDDRERG